MMRNNSLNIACSIYLTIICGFSNQNVLGIHAAFRAYRNTLEVLGPDYALPNDLVGQFTNDQLFFLSFAQPWCEQF